MLKKTLFRPRVEQLETRRCLTAVIEAVAVETTPDQPAEVTMSSQETEAADQLDTNGDGVVTARDALVVINYLGRSSLPEGAEGVAPVTESPANLDANGDGRVSALDALVIVNRLGRIEPSNPSPVSSNSFTNPTNPFDVDNSGAVSADDVDLILSSIERFGVGNLNDLDRDEVGFVDVNQDGILSAADALAVINHLTDVDDEADELQEELEQAF